MRRRDFLKLLGLAPPVLYFDMGKNLHRQLFVPHPDTGLLVYADTGEVVDSVNGIIPALIGIRQADGQIETMIDRPCHKVFAQQIEVRTPHTQNLKSHEQLDRHERWFDTMRISF